MHKTVAALASVAALLASSRAMATNACGSNTSLCTPQLQYNWQGSAGTVVFIHGKSDCSTKMGDCNSGDSTTGPRSYWTNDYDNLDMMNEATTNFNSSNQASYYEAFSIGYDLDNQGFWDSASDVGACLKDLYSGTNVTGCNPSKYQRTSFYIVTHSAGGTVIDRLVSNNYYSVNSHIKGIASLAPALAGSRASSALYGIDGYSNFCTSLVSWVAGWAEKSNGSSSLTRSSVIGQANALLAGKSPIWINKVPNPGGSYSANNDGCGTISGGVTVREDDNDCAMGTLAGCLGYSSSDDTDGLLYWSDTDPTANPAVGSNGCQNDNAYGGTTCKSYAQFSGAYWHWFVTWDNHSHSRDDAYHSYGDDPLQSYSGCYYRSPGTCVGQYFL